MIKHGQFWYVGTPYSKFHGGLDAAFQMACKVTAELAMLDIPVYSPIAHSHPVALFCQVDPRDHDFWVKFDAPMVRAAGGLIVVMEAGWEKSLGLHHEILTFQREGKPVVYWDPQKRPNLDLLRPIRSH